MIRAKNKRDLAKRQSALDEIASEERTKTAINVAKFQEPNFTTCVCAFIDIFSDLTEEELKGAIKVLGRSSFVEIYAVDALIGLYGHAIQEKVERLNDFPELLPEK